MRDFTASQSDLLAKGGLHLEMLAALLNNNVDAYGQSLEFTEHVQAREGAVGGATPGSALACRRRSTPAARLSRTEAPGFGVAAAAPAR
jgi:hypothetical protein